MRFFRAERVGKLLREELAKIIEREIEFAPGVLVTVTEAEVDKKLEHARVKVGVIPSSAGGASLKALTASAGRLQFLATKKLNIKPMPRIVFVLDRGTENAANVEKALLSK